MSITAHSRSGGDSGSIGRLPMLVAPLGALLYPFALEHRSERFDALRVYLPRTNSYLEWVTFWLGKSALSVATSENRERPSRAASIRLPRFDV